METGYEEQTTLIGLKGKTAVRHNNGNKMFNAQQGEGVRVKIYPTKTGD